jgi:hypothetical protein
MGERQEGKWVVPNPQVPRTFGILNIIFGILLLLFGIYSIVMLWLGPKLQNYMMGQFEQQKTTAKATRDAKIADLKKREETAQTKEEKESLADERAAVERTFEPDMTGFMEETRAMTQRPVIRIYSAVEGGLGIVLNILMIVSGVGLLRVAEWGRRLALSVAWLKILRWIAIVAFTLIVIVPMTTEMTQKLLTQVEAQAKANSRGATPFPMATLSQFAAVAGAVSSVMTALFAVIYPILLLWFMTRPSTIAAVVAKARSSAPPPDFEVGAPT